MRSLVLVLVIVAGVGVAAWLLRPGPAVPPPAAAGPRLVWAFEGPQPGSAVAAPLVTPETVYLAAVHARGFKLSGAVYALNPETGKPRWVFDRDGDMLPTASSPLLAGGRLFLGEGMHANFACKFYALDAATGATAWSIDTADHVEGGPALDGPNVIFPAGNDGLYAADAATGAARWNFRADLHIDSTPTVAGGRVYVGSGPSRRFQSSQVVCLDARTGAPVWRTPVALPAWPAPVVADGAVFAGLGNGRLTEGAKPPEVPAGALACFDAATGAARWTFPVADAVFGEPLAAGGRVVFGSRDGHLYGVSYDGREVFRVPMGGPVVAAPAAAGGLVYAVSVPGSVVCVDPADGREVWRYDLGRGAAAPLAYAPLRVAGRRLYVAAEIQTPGSSIGIVSLSCLELPPAGGHQEESK